MRRLGIEEHIKEFKDYAKEINSSEEKTTEFYVKAGIHTPTGKLKRVYYHRIIKTTTKK